LEPFEQVLFEFTLPSHFTLSRYYKSFVDQFHKHYPLVHLPTLRIEQAPPELALVIAAIGAQYRFEFKNGLALYRAAKAITFEQLKSLEQEDGSTAFSDIHSLPTDARDVAKQSRRTDMLRTLVMLIAFSSWDWEADLLRDAFGLQSILARYLREDGMREKPCGSNNDWHDWIIMEGARRVKMIAFAYLSLQSTAYNLPPVMLNSEVELRLPDSTEEWNASDSTQWQLIRDRVQHPNIGFQDAVNILVDKTQGSEAQRLLSQLSPLANFILLQALIQRICLIRQLSITGDAALREADLEEME
jgi:hypothetical protein